MSESKSVIYVTKHCSLALGGGEGAITLLTTDLHFDYAKFKEHSILTKTTFKEHNAPRTIIFFIILPIF